MMKSHTLSIVILLTIITTLFIACKNDKVKTAGDVDGPVITVFEPLANTIYATGDTIFLSAYLEDLSPMQDFTVHLVYSVDTLLLWPDVPGILGNLTSYTLNFWTFHTISLNENAIIRFEARDKHDNTTIVDVPVELQM